MRQRKRFGWACAILVWNRYIYIYIWIKIEYQEPHEAEKTVWVGMCHLSVGQIHIYIYIYMDKNRIPRTPRGRENGLGGLAPTS